MAHLLDAATLTVRRQIDAFKAARGDDDEGRVVWVHASTYHDLGEEEVRGFRKALLGWYDRVQRVLPWRVPSGVGEGLGVWVSEIMLQQTQVATVISYYNTWMKKWPTIFDLAKADLEDVNKVWSGLGYYSRARRLLEASRLIVTKFNGVLPKDPKILEKEVPGIGPYTAGAIASIAYNVPAPLVDGNVIRVLSRLLALGVDPKSKPAIELH
ncbi:hypothetical protein HDU67_009983, partial [Dinochytrium kinnereticum]